MVGLLDDPQAATSPLQITPHISVSPMRPDMRPLYRAPGNHGVTPLSRCYVRSGRLRREGFELFCPRSRQDEQRHRWAWARVGDLQPRAFGVRERAREGQADPVPVADAGGICGRVGREAGPLV